MDTRVHRDRVRAKLRRLGLGLTIVLDTEARTRYGTDFATLLVEKPGEALHILRDVVGPDKAEMVLSILLGPAAGAPFNRGARLNRSQKIRGALILAA